MTHDSLACDDVLAGVEAVAAGEAPPSAAWRAHLEACPRCSAALASARRIEEALAVRPAPSAPARFTAATLGRIRREQWRSEQQVDRLFNAAILFGLVLIVGGVLALVNLTGVMTVGVAAFARANELASRLQTRAAPAVRTYVFGAGLLLTALAVWWWAERKLTL
ncbi:MAG TPA: hypothetical protein VFX12_15285 [Vicinamibacterales bacterium]|nr:hypothetical protein [Vicinamibacterales bacterium]